MTEIKLGYVTLVDLAKINALLDMRSDVDRHYVEKARKGTKQYE